MLTYLTKKPTTPVYAWRKNFLYFFLFAFLLTNCLEISLVQLIKQQQLFTFIYILCRQHKTKAFFFSKMEKVCFMKKKTKQKIVKKRNRNQNNNCNLRFVANLFVVPVSELNQSAVSLIRKMV